MHISVKQLIGITRCSNGFIGAVTGVLGDEKYSDPTYALTQEDVTRIEVAYEREFGTPAAIGSETIFGTVSPEMYSASSAAFYNQAIAANSFFKKLGFTFAERTSTA